MRSIWVLSAAFLTMAAAPVDDAVKLVEAGRGKEAVALLEKAAATKDADAIDYLAQLYDDGEVVSQDLSHAAILYRQAAELGNTHAQWRLGVMLDMSEGVKENPKEAVEWFRKAAAKRDRSAVSSLAAMYANGRGVSQDFTEAKRLYLEAARLGEPHGFFGVALLYYNGQGVKPDPIESLAWMWVAANLGDRQAKKALTEYELPSSDTRIAAERANAIAREFGYQNVAARFVDCDADKSASTECKRFKETQGIQTLPQSPN